MLLVLVHWWLALHLRISGFEGPHWWVRPGPSANAGCLVGKASSWCVCLQGPGSGTWCLPDGEWSRSWAPLMGSAKFLGVWELKGVDGI